MQSSPKTDTNSYLKQYIDTAPKEPGESREKRFHRRSASVAEMAEPTIAS